MSKGMLNILLLATCLSFSVIASANGESVYNNEQFGITFNEPAGWIRQIGSPDSYLVSYTKMGPDNQKVGTIMVTVDDISNAPEINTALDFAKIILQKQIYELVGSKVVKPPEMIDVNGIAAAAIMYDMPPGEENAFSNAPVSTLMVFVMQGRNIITINVLSRIDAWEATTADMGSIMNSIKVKGAVMANAQ